MKDGIYFKTIIVKDGNEIAFPLRSLTEMVAVLAPFLFEAITAAGVIGEDEAMKRLNSIRWDT